MFGVITAHARGAGALALTGVAHAVDQRGQEVELLGIRVLGEVVLARIGA